MTEAKKALRGRLRVARQVLAARDPDVLSAVAHQVADWLASLPATACVGFYWPLPGEVDLRDAIVQWLAQDPRRHAALPAVIATSAPLAFHRWRPGMLMRSGAYGILIPDDAETVAPDFLLLPCLGFDARGYRLGYGGGFYDRTLAALTPRPVAVGVAPYAVKVEALPITAYDVPLDEILTERGRLLYC